MSNQEDIEMSEGIKQENAQDGVEDQHDNIIRVRRDSIDILSSSLDNIVNGPAPSATIFDNRKESDANALFAASTMRKESDASALFSFTSVGKDSDASAVSTLVKDEEEMMQQDEDMLLGSRSRSNSLVIGGRSRSNSLMPAFGKQGDPFDNLRKLSDASDIHLRKLSDDNTNFRKLSDQSDLTLRKFSESSDPLKNLGKESEDALGVGGLDSMKSPESTGTGILGEMKIKFDTSRDDGSVHLFENPVVSGVEPTPYKRARLNTSDHLDMLTNGKESDDGSTSTATLNEANQKMLMEALLGPGRRNRAESWGGMSDISAHHAALVNNIASNTDSNAIGTPRGPSPTPFEGVMMSPKSPSQDSLAEHLHQNESKTRRRSGSIGIPEKIGVPSGEKRERLDSFSGMTISTSKQDRSMSFTRERLGSWAPRDRLDSVATRDRLDSLANLSGIFSKRKDRADSFLSGLFTKGRDRLDSLASLGEVSLTMSIGDLEDVAGQLESVMQNEDSDINDSASEATAPACSHRKLSGPPIHVDSEAVQCAVKAAMAVTSGLDVLNMTPNKKAGSDSATPLISNKNSASSQIGIDNKRREEIRAKARADAGYSLLEHHPASAKSLLKSKKRPLSNAIHPSGKKPWIPSQSSHPIAKPKLASGAKVSSGVQKYADMTSATPKKKNTSSSRTPSSSSKGGQSNQKWEEMFECLVQYVKDQKEKETNGMTKEEFERWEWSGNVPTMYKTKDGKALGRWINNQRSAKSKGSLKPEREKRLIGTGLKWSVLTTNAWTDMMEELKVYVKEKQKDGQQWDGNVPTNYKIKTSTKGDDNDEDKNLGRWINRQRSLYQAGKLRDERRLQLESIGLKWAVLSTTSWHTMFDALCKYAQARRVLDANGYWDGNVPASYETEDKPPKKLGRWVNRQRSAYANKKLKKEFVDKLEKAGLKWTASDSKKDMDTDVLLRQRALLQSKSLANATPLSAVSSSTIVRPHVTSTARATTIVRTAVPGTTRVIPSTVTSSSTIPQKTQPTIVTKGGAPGVQKVVLPQRTTVSTVQGTRIITTTVNGQTKKVIIPARSVPGTSTSKVIIPARSLAQHAAANGKIVIPARSTGTGSKVIIPARSLLQAGTKTVNGKVVVVPRSAVSASKVVIPAGSLPQKGPAKVVASTGQHLPAKTMVPKVAPAGVQPQVVLSSGTKISSTLKTNQRVIGMPQRTAGHVTSTATTMGKVVPMATATVKTAPITTNASKAVPMATVKTVPVTYKKVVNGQPTVRTIGADGKPIIMTKSVQPLSTTQSVGTQKQVTPQVSANGTTSQNVVKVANGKVVSQHITNNAAVRSNVTNVQHLASVKGQDGKPATIVTKGAHVLNTAVSSSVVRRIVPGAQTNIASTGAQPTRIVQRQVVPGGSKVTVPTSSNVVKGVITTSTQYMKHPNQKAINTNISTSSATPQIRKIVSNASSSNNTATTQQGNKPGQQVRHVTTASTNSTSVPATTVNLNTKTNVTVGSVRTSNVISTKVTPLVSLQGRNSGPDKAGKALITASSHIQATQQQRVPITQTSKVVTNSQGSTSSVSPAAVYKTAPRQQGPQLSSVVPIKSSVLKSPANNQIQTKMISVPHATKVMEDVTTSQMTRVATNMKSSPSPSVISQKGIAPQIKVVSTPTTSLASTLPLQSKIVQTSSAQGPMKAAAKPSGTVTTAATASTLPLQSKIVQTSSAQVPMKAAAKPSGTVTTAATLPLQSKIVQTSSAQGPMKAAAKPSGTVTTAATAATLPLQSKIVQTASAQVPMKAAAKPSGTVTTAATAATLPLQSKIVQTSSAQILGKVTAKPSGTVTTAATAATLPLQSKIVQTSSAQGPMKAAAKPSGTVTVKMNSIANSSTAHLQPPTSTRAPKGDSSTMPPSIASVATTVQMSIQKAQPTLKIPITSKTAVVAAQTNSPAGAVKAKHEPVIKGPDTSA